MTPTRKPTMSTSLSNQLGRGGGTEFESQPCAQKPGYGPVYVS